jgi:DNA-binding CsgD family transcriptional regulator
MKKVIDILYKRQNYLLGIAVFLSLSAVSITVNNGHTKLNLSNYPILMIGLVLISILLVFTYIKIDQSRIRTLSKEIKESKTNVQNEGEQIAFILTSRQYEVYQLIAEGKSNKEIMSDLYIEQSTLKTHINQIYKKLNIKSRKELRSNINS